MSDEFVIFDSGQREPATHAVVIGIGNYPHLIGGSGHRTDSHDGMKQLSSPPVSARAFADWLLSEFKNPEHPLGTVQLLVSEANPAPFILPDGTSVDIGLADFKNIETAINHWRELADEQLGNMTIFYFCGHGISEGNSMVLLPSDFGSQDNAFKHSIDFLNIYDSMDQYKAQRQCFFVDACRASSDSLALNKGTSILQSRPREAEGTRVAPIYYATLKTDLAFGLTDQPSFFTTALLDCLSHFGADDAEGDWRTSNFGLSLALDHVMDDFIKAGLEKAQTPDSAEIRQKFAINHLQHQPHALFYVKGEPHQMFLDASIRCTDSTTTATIRAPVVAGPDAEAEDWLIRITAGQTTIEALDSEENQLVSDQVHVSPPYRKHRLKLP